MDRTDRLQGARGFATRSLTASDWKTRRVVVHQDLRPSPTRAQGVMGNGLHALLARKPIRPTGPARLAVYFNGDVEPPNAEAGSFLRRLGEERTTGFG